MVLLYSSGIQGQIKLFHKLTLIFYHKNRRNSHAPLQNFTFGYVYVIEEKGDIKKGYPIIEFTRLLCI